MNRQTNISIEFSHQKVKEPKRTYSKGQYFSRGGGVYILSCVGDEYCCINLTTGNRFDEPIPVEDPSRISDDEVQEMLSDDFEPIDNIKVIVG